MLKRSFGWFATIVFLLVAGPSLPRDCRALKALGEPPYTADNYPFPLSLRTNLIFLMKEEMAKRGEYDASLTSGVFTLLLENQIKGAQARLGQETTGCITWEIVRAYDSQGRAPPPVALK